MNTPEDLRYRQLWGELADRVRADDVAWKLLKELDQAVADLAAAAADARIRLAPATDDDLLVLCAREQERRGVTPGSIRAREGRLRQFAAYLAPRRLLSATHDDVVGFIDGLDLKQETRRNYMSHLGAFYRFAVAEEFIVRSPMARVRPPRQTKGLPRPIADADLAKVLAHVRRRPDDFASRRVECFLTLGAFGGLRAQEIAGLGVDDVDLERGIIRIVHGKGAKQRTVPLHPDVRAALVALPMPAAGRVFFNLRQRGSARAGELAAWCALPERDRAKVPRPAGADDPEPLPPHMVSHAVNDLFERLGIPSTCHGLRHYFASKVYQHSGDVRLTQELLGHGNINTTVVYAAFDTRKAGPTVEALAVEGS